MLNKTLFLIIYLLIFVEAKSQQINCQEKPDHEINLRSKGKSLENFETQDQGNIGSCYANALSVALETKIHYQPSVNHLAIISHNEDKGREVTDGGDSCDLFDNLGNNYICPSSSVPLDEMTRNGIDVVLENLGAFYDDINNKTLKKSGEKYQEILKT